MLKNECKNIASFKKYLEIQHYNDELKHLEKKYGLPHGIAYYDDKVAGCIGLKKIDEKNCEMKRLYVIRYFTIVKISINNKKLKI